MIFNHAAVAGEITVDYAHKTMQIHLDCLITQCPAKRQAKSFLIRKGHMVPDLRRTYGSIPVCG